MSDSTTTEATSNAAGQVDCGDIQPTCALPDSLTDAQAMVGAWTTETFPAATPETQLEHLRREVYELLESNADGEREDQEEEAADCLLLLLGYATRAGFDLHEAAARKHRVNQGRTWSAPDADGVQEHV